MPGGFGSSLLIAKTAESEVGKLSFDSANRWPARLEAARDGLRERLSPAAKPLIFVIGLAVVVGCTRVETTNLQSGSGARVNAFTQPHVLRYSDGEDIASLNPHLTQQYPVGLLSELTMAWFVRYDRDNRPVPELLTEIPTKPNGGISADGKKITWRLREGVTWSDGVPFNADDVVFSTRTVLDPANNEVSRDGWNLITQIDKLDSHTVAFHLSRPYAAYLPTFFGSAGANPCLLPAHLFKNQANINAAPYNALPVGIGPFKYVRWKRGDSVELVANPAYFRGRPKLERIVYKIIPDRNTVLTQLQTGALDLWADVGAGFYDRVKQLPSVASQHVPGFYYQHIDLNVAHPVLADPAVRQALRYATDRKTLVAKVNHGLGIVQESVISPVSSAVDVKIPAVEFDLAKANALLESGGWLRGPDGVRTKNGTKLHLDFATASGSPDGDRRIEVIRATWRQVGVDITVRHYPPSLLFGPLSNGGILYSGKFDAMTFAWGGTPLGDLSITYECKMKPPNGQNTTRYCNPKVDQALEAFKQQYESAERRPYANFVVEQLAKDVPVIVLYIEEDLYAYNRDLKNFRPGAATPFDDFMNVDI